MVTVLGANLSSAGAYPGFTDGNLLCRFGGSDGETVNAIPMTHSDAVQCEAPPSPAENAGTEVRSAFQAVEMQG